MPTCTTNLYYLVRNDVRGTRRRKIFSPASVQYCTVSIPTIISKHSTITVVRCAEYNCTVGSYCASYCTVVNGSSSHCSSFSKKKAFHILGPQAKKDRMWGIQNPEHFNNDQCDRVIAVRAIHSLLTAVEEAAVVSNHQPATSNQMPTATLTNLIRSFRTASKIFGRIWSRNPSSGSSPTLSYFII